MMILIGKGLNKLASIEATSEAKKAIVNENHDDDDDETSGDVSLKPVTYRLFASPHPHFLVGCHHHDDDDHDDGDDDDNDDDGEKDCNCLFGLRS